MSKSALGAATGTLLGLLDGLSAWAYPEARAMILAIVVGSTLKGLLTGVIAGYLARRWRSMRAGIVAGVAIGFVLSSVAAIPVAMEESARYFDVVLPGMLVGALVGFVTQRYPRTSARVGSTAIAVMLTVAALPVGIGAQQMVAADPLDRLQFVVDGPDEFDEIFELAEPGKDFQLFACASAARQIVTVFASVDRGQSLRRSPARDPSSR